MNDDINRIYCSNPENADDKLEQSYYDLREVNNGERYDPSYYENHERTSEDLLDQGIYQSNPRAKATTRSPSVKKTSTIISLAATLVASAIGAISIINPLLYRPTINNGVYSLIENNLSYSFTLSSQSNYECHLHLVYLDEAIEDLLLEEPKTYKGSFLLSDPGIYQLVFYRTNNIDFRLTSLLYQCIYVEEAK